jgi:hypothetical protein
VLAWWVVRKHRVAQKTLVQGLYKQVSEYILTLKNQRLSWISINDDRSIRGRLNLRRPCKKVAPVEDMVRNMNS